MKEIYIIKKEVRFEAGHFLRDVDEEHPCAKQHGHSYITFVTLRSQLLDETGFVLDFNYIKALIRGRFDHVNLNDAMARNPTAENIASEIGRMVNDLLFKMECNDEVKLIEVEVRETATGSATVRWET